MSRVLCMECKNNNHGWCNVRKTNKLKDLITCEYREMILYDHKKEEKDLNVSKYKEIDNFMKLKSYYEQKKWEYENIDIEHDICNEGVLKGLKIAIDIMSK